MGCGLLRPAEFSTTCQVALNSQGGDGPAIAIAQCDPDGNFTLSDVPAGAYEMAVCDQWLDQIIQAVAVTVPEGGSKLVAMGNHPGAELVHAVRPEHLPGSLNEGTARYI